MNRILILVAATLMSVAALADHHQTVENELRDAVMAFNAAYAENRVNDYFGRYADDATVYFYGARQDMKAYYEEWAGMIDAGGGVEMNEMSDLRIQVMPSGDVGIATYFVDYRSRAPDGQISAAKAFETEVWQKIEGDWRIVSLHYSEIHPE